MMFKFGEFETDIDAVDLDFETNFEKYYQEMIEEINSISPSGLRSNRIIKYCTSVFQFFNNLFGEGTDKKMFGDKTNMRVCDAAIEALAESISKSLDEFNKQSEEGIKRIENAFAPKQNRAQRRAKK